MTADGAPRRFPDPFDEAAATLDPDGSAGSAPRRVRSPDAVHRSVRATGPDGVGIEVLAARRGTPMREGFAAGDGGGPDDIHPVAILVWLAMLVVVHLLLGPVLRWLARGRPWKVAVYRDRRVLPKRLHREVLPRGVEPEARMLELLEQHAPTPPASG